MDTSLKTKIHLVLVCYICSASGFSQKQKLLAHLQSHHHVYLPSAKRGKPPKNNFLIVSLKEATITHYACPSCFSHFDSLNTLADHCKLHNINV
ncbi:hypothetical protein CLU79DRAFT_706111 [Phycomyces nitens]|nr:hypothetical protein CLU79DRAFT_706111 [Phycomyces nitens]